MCALFVSKAIFRLIQPLTIQPVWRHHKLRIRAACISHRRPRQCAGTSSLAARPYCSPAPLPRVAGCCTPADTATTVSLLWNWQKVHERSTKKKKQHQVFVRIPFWGKKKSKMKNRTSFLGTLSLTVLDLVNLSSHLMASSGETLLFDKSMYPKDTAENTCSEFFFMAVNIQDNLTG